MDSITQAVLGAVVADLTMGRQLGRRAAGWGLVVGTLPDLDVVVSPWLSTIELMAWHRGVSHGLLAMVLISPLLGWILHRWYRSHGLTWCRASLAVGLVWLTHVLIDCLNLYGTGLWEPFSSSWFSFRLMFIIDPLFSLPLVVATIAALGWSSQRSWRLPLSWALLGVSCGYVGWAVAAKTITNQRFATSLAQIDNDHSLRVQQWQTAPLPLTTVLWRCLAQVERRGEDGVEQGFLIGLASLVDDDPRVVWRWVPQIVYSGENAELFLDTLYDHAGFAAARWFSQGNWVLVSPSTPDEKPRIHDIRFGSMQLDRSPIDPVHHPWAFSWHITTTADGEEDLAKVTSLLRDTSALPSLWSRLRGQRYEWEQRALEAGQANFPLVLY